MIDNNLVLIDEDSSLYYCSQCNSRTQNPNHNCEIELRAILAEANRLVELDEQLGLIYPPQK